MLMMMMEMMLVVMMMPTFVDAADEPSHKQHYIQSVTTRDPQHSGTVHQSDSENKTVG